MKQGLLRHIFVKFSKTTTISHKLYVPTRRVFLRYRPKVQSLGQYGNKNGLVPAPVNAVKIINKLPKSNAVTALEINLMT